MKFYDAWNYLNNHVIFENGDGFSMFSKYEEIESTSNTDNQALINFIKNELRGVIPEKYRNTGK